MGRLRTALSDSAPPNSTVFEVLQKRRRRYAFHYLRQQGEEVSIGDLSDHVAAWESGTSVEGVDLSARQRVYVSLLQNHLPKMDEEDMVTFDPDSGTVALTNNAAALDIYLETVPRNDILWAQYYLGLTVLSGGFLLLVAQGVSPFVDYTMVVWGSITVAFLLSTLLHHRYLRVRRLGTEGSPPSEL